MLCSNDPHIPHCEVRASLIIKQNEIWVCTLAVALEAFDLGPHVCCFIKFSAFAEAPPHCIKV